MVASIASKSEEGDYTRLVVKAIIDECDAHRRGLDTEFHNQDYFAHLTAQEPPFDPDRLWMVGRATAAVVAESGGVVGFASLSPYRTRPGYSTTVEDSVYVHHEHRGHGYGRLLLEELVDRGSDHGFHTVIGRIVGHHEASIGLHARCGFEHAGTEREVGRKFGRWLDVVLMQRML